MRRTDSDAGDEEAAGRVMREFADAMARDDFERACTYYSKAARALLLAVASFAGLKTDSCAEALAYVMEQDAGTEEAVDASMWKRLGEVTFEVKLTGDDRATAIVDSSRTPGNTSELPITKDVPLVKEDGQWKFGMRFRDDLPRG